MRLLIFALLLLAACASTVPTVPAATPTPPAPTRAPDAFLIDAAQTLGPASPFVLGTNYGPYMYILPEVKSQFEQAGIRFFRFPGGAWGDQRDLEEYEIDQFIALARRNQIEPLISVRLAGGSPQQAAALVNMAREKNYNVRYWSIGNEPDLYARGANADTRWNTEFYNQQWRAFAEAMKQADPQIQLVGPDTSQFTGNETTDPKDAQGKNWLREFLRANGDLVNVVAVHRYPFPKNASDPAPTVPELFDDAARWTDLIKNLRAVTRAELKRDAPIAITEWNSNWVDATGGETTPDSFNNALWLAAVMGQMLQERVDLAAHWRLLSPPGGFGIISKYDVYPTYYTYQMYKKFGTVIVAAESQTPGVYVFAARKNDGSLTLAFVNLNDAAVTKPLQLDGFQSNGDATLWQFDAQHNAARVGAQNVANGMQLTVPPRAMQLYEIPGF